MKFILLKKGKNQIKSFLLKIILTLLGSGIGTYIYTIFVSKSLKEAIGIWIISAVAFLLGGFFEAKAAAKRKE